MATMEMRRLDLTNPEPDALAAKPEWSSNGVDA